MAGRGLLEENDPCAQVFGEAGNATAIYDASNLNSITAINNTGDPSDGERGGAIAGGAVGDIAHDLGEADEMDIDLGGGEARANLVLELARNLDVVQPLARRGIDFDQLNADNRGGEIVGDQAPDDVGLEQIFPHLGQEFRRRLEVGRHDVAAGEAALDDFDDDDLDDDTNLSAGIGIGFRMGRGILDVEYTQINDYVDYITVGYTLPF